MEVKVTYSEVIERIKNQLLVDFDDNFKARELVLYLSNRSYERFLIGNSHNEKATRQALSKHIMWRLEIEIDQISLETCQRQVDKRFAFFHGKNIVGRPVIYCFPSKHRRGDGDVEELKNFVIYTLENGLKSSISGDEQIFAYIDLSSFGFQNMDVQFVRLFAGILQANYPDILSGVVIVNAPSIFWAFWRIVKLFIDPVSAAKVQFCDRQKADEYIALSEYPVEVSGEQIDLQM